MKKSLFALLFLVLLFAAFRGGTWYSQRWAGGNHETGGERPILHYVDPMNPANVSDKPGIAPCGMPMEPVYGDGDADGTTHTATGAVLPPGTVKITPHKQQLIGVRLGIAELVEETHKIRTLGRIAADENRIFPLFSAVDGWMSYIAGSTTGSLVQKNQLMALIRIYDYDFFSWQQRYLIELANTGRRRLPATNFTGARQPLAYPGRSPETDAPSMDMPSSEMEDETAPHSMPLPEPAPSEALPQGGQGEQGELAPHPAVKSPLGMPYSAMQGKVSPQAAKPQAEGGKAEMPQPEAAANKEKKTAVKQNTMDHSMDEESALGADQLDPAFMREDDILYANKARIELLNRGVRNVQLEALGQTGKYVTTIEIRSPVTGLLIDRKISPLEKVERGTECFRVADLSRVWILADVFNTDAQYIRPGMDARISLPRQNKQFDARVSDILPEFDATTRTLKTRLEMKNPDNTFRPEMFVDVEFLVTLPPAVTVPADAVLDSGDRKIVFVALGDGYFEPREVVTGWQFDNRIEIISGLVPGEQFVISGNFLIDSESRIKRAAAGLMAKPAPENSSSDKEKQGAADRKKLSHD